MPAKFTVSTALDVVSATDGKLSLREAVTRANNSPGADTIVLPAGVFKIAIDGANENGNATGDFDINDDLVIQGAGAGLTVLDGQQRDRLFDLIGPIGVRFAAVTLRHGGGVASGSGGIQALDADVALVNCVLSDNRGVLGGGIDAEAGDVTLVGTAILRNIAQFDGGGLRLGSGTLTLTNSSVRHNLAGGSGGGLSASSVHLVHSTVLGNSAATTGGGVAAGTVTLTNSTVGGNTSRYGLGDAHQQDGGGIFASTVTGTKSTIRGNAAGGAGGGIAAESVTLTGCTVIGNSADTNGGGISATTAAVTGSTVTGNAALNRAFGIAAGLGGGISAATVSVVRSTVGDNSADVRGGGVYATESVTATNSTMSGNSTENLGGGIYSEGTANLTACTVCGNTAFQGGGVAAEAGALLDCTIAENVAQFSGGGVFHFFAGGPFTVKNTIIAQNVALEGPDVINDFVTQGHNLIGDATDGSGFADGVSGDLVGAATNPIDPKLGPLANNGGPTQTMALLAGSPAIDHGDNTDVPLTDQRGVPRIKDGNGDGRAIVDIGAFER